MCLSAPGDVLNARLPPAARALIWQASTGRAEFIDTRARPRRDRERAMEARVPLPDDHSRGAKASLRPRHSTDGDRGPRAIPAHRRSITDDASPNRVRLPPRRAGTSSSAEFVTVERPIVTRFGRATAEPSCCSGSMLAPDASWSGGAATGWTHGSPTPRVSEPIARGGRPVPVAPGAHRPLVGEQLDRRVGVFRPLLGDAVNGASAAVLAEQQHQVLACLHRDARSSPALAPISMRANGCPPTRPETTWNAGSSEAARPTSFVCTRFEPRSVLTSWARLRQKSRNIGIGSSSTAVTSRNER